MNSEKLGPFGADLDSSGEELAAEVYEGDLHALRQRQELPVEPGARQPSAEVSKGRTRDADSSRDSLWPLIR